MLNVTQKARSALKAIYMSSELNEIGYHFNYYFRSIIANSDDIKEEAYKLRHDVFCKELKLFELKISEQENDMYDAYSTQCLIQHKSTHDYTGVVRMIMPETQNQLLPIEKIALEHITNKAFLPSNFPKEDICEISRIAISPKYRRRETDKFKGAATAGIDINSYNETEKRCFPFISAGLYLACAAHLIAANRKHAYFMIEPFMAKSLKFVGVPIKCIGNEFDYVGTRKPYYVDNQSFKKSIRPSLKYMFDAFLKEDLAKENNNV